MNSCTANRAKLTAAEFRQKCREYAAEQVEGQKKDFIRLGVLGDWDRPYLTMDFKTEANIIRALGKIISNGHLLKGAAGSLVHRLRIVAGGSGSGVLRQDFAVDRRELPCGRRGCRGGQVRREPLQRTISLVIWTTTPWTLPANRAISLHPDFTYQLVQVDGQCLILAAELVESVMKRAGITEWTVLGSCKGAALELLRFKHPFMDFDVPAILGEHVTLDAGTGAVHTAPGHGPDDFVIGQKYGLEVANPVGPNGCYLTGTYPLLDGKFVFKANDLIVDLLRESALLHVEKFLHSYPCCWRHKTPIIFRATPQWFVSMDQKGLRQQSLEEIKGVQWIGLGPGAHRNDGGQPPGLVHLASAHLGRADVTVRAQRNRAAAPRTVELMEEVASASSKTAFRPGGIWTRPTSSARKPPTT